MGWLLHVLGVDDVSGRWYAWWSGAGSDLGELAVVGALAAMVRKHNCEVHRCWRIGRHTTAAGHLVCARHHPGGAPSAEQVAHAHRARLEDRLRAHLPEAARRGHPPSPGGTSHAH